MISTGRSHCAMTLAMVNVFPEPVTPIRVWYRLPARIDPTSFSIACGWSPVGWYPELSLNSMANADHIGQAGIMSKAVVSTLYDSDVFRMACRQFDQAADAINLPEDIRDRTKY